MLFPYEVSSIQNASCNINRMEHFIVPAPIYPNTSGGTALVNGQPTGNKKAVQEYQRRIIVARDDLREVTKNTLRELPDVVLDTVNDVLKKRNKEVKNQLPLRSARGFKESPDLSIIETYQVATALIEYLGMIADIKKLAYSL